MFLFVDIGSKLQPGENIYHYPEKDIKLIFYKSKLLNNDVTLLEYEGCK